MNLCNGLIIVRYHFTLWSMSLCTQQQTYQTCVQTSQPCVLQLHWIVWYWCIGCFTVIPYALWKIKATPCCSSRFRDRGATDAVAAGARAFDRIQRCDQLKALVLYPVYKGNPLVTTWRRVNVFQKIPCFSMRKLITIYGMIPVDITSISADLG